MSRIRQKFVECPACKEKPDLCVECAERRALFWECERLKRKIRRLCHLSQEIIADWLEKEIDEGLRKSPIEGVAPVPEKNPFKKGAEFKENK